MEIFAKRRGISVDRVKNILSGTFGDLLPEAQYKVKPTPEAMLAGMEKGEEVKLSGFGNFSLLKKKARPGRNPKTGKKIALERRNTVHFKPSKELKSRVNNI